MNLSYEEFIKLIPEETKKYVNNVLKCLNQYVIGRSNIYKEIVGEDSTLSLEGYYYDIAIFSEMLTETNDYANIIRNIRRKNISSISNSRGNFILEDTKKVDDETLKKIFNMYKESFLIYDDISYYYGLTPLEILNNFIIKNDIYTTDDNYLFPNKLSAINAKNNITKIIKEKRKEFESNLSIELFKDVPIDIVNIITNASKIYNYNIKHINGMLYNNIYDLVSGFILLSYLHSEDTDIKNIVKKLELPSGVIEFYKKEYADITGDIDFEPNYYGIKMYYQKYYNDLKNKTIENMFINLFNRDITKSTYVEEILNKYNIDKEKVINIFDTRTNQEKLEDILSNYSYDINKLINLSKIYSLTLKKVNTNNSYLRNCNDILSYSYFTYLTFYEKDNILYNYFNDNMIDLNKINSLFNINLTQEEIEKENISLECINDIVAKNINNFDEYFINETKSKFLINIFNLLSNEKIENLNNELNNYKIQKEIEYKDKIYLELFDSLDKDTISFIKLFVENNKYLTDNIKLNISKKDLIVLSIIYSSFGEFLYEKYGITKEDSNKFLGINNTKKDNYNYTEEDNELLYKNYYDFIFNGFNSDINRKDIKPQHILRNIFNKSLYNGAFLIKYLHNFNLNSNDFDDLITKYDNFLYEKQTKTMIDNICKYDNEKVYLELIIYKALAINTRLNEINTNLNKIDKEKISLILGYIITYTIYFDDIKYKDDENIFGIKSLSDNNITLNNISKYLNISIEELKYNTSLVDYKLFSNYAKYFNFDVDENSNALIKMMSKLFDQEINNSNILSIIGNLSNEDNIKLNIELRTFKPYIPTISECIDSLRSLEVKEMNMEDVNDILNYGNELSKHFVTINDMEHKLLNGDSNEKSIANINEIITESYEVIEPKKVSLNGYFMMKILLKKILL